MDVLSLENIQEIERALGYHFKDISLLKTALTHKSKHFEDPVSYKQFNERLEFLGDAVLSLCISECLFSNPKNFTESQMSKMKSYLVKESVLHEIAQRLNLGKYIVLGKGEESTGGRQKKSILADTVEAVIGAIFIDSSYENAKGLVVGIFQEKITNVINKKEGRDYKSELQEVCQSRFNLLPVYLVIKQEGEEHKKIFTVEVCINGKVMGRGIGKTKKEAESSSAKEALSRLGL
ncbi:MAG: ribonuclease III [Thermodesulfovibrionales bacterium]|nr:ribonuclease III [Thermodesulfovibrionales bacterium]